MSLTKAARKLAAVTRIAAEGGRQASGINGDPVQVIARIGISGLGELRETEDHGIARVEQVVVTLERDSCRTRLLAKVLVLGPRQDQVGNGGLQGSNPGERQYADSVSGISRFVARRGCHRTILRGTTLCGFVRRQFRNILAGLVRPRPTARTKRCSSQSPNARQAAWAKTNAK